MVSSCFVKGKGFVVDSKHRWANLRLETGRVIVCRGAGVGAVAGVGVGSLVSVRACCARANRLRVGWGGVGGWGG